MPYWERANENWSPELSECEIHGMWVGSANGALLVAGAG